MTGDIPEWLRDYVVKSGDVIQRFPDLMHQSDERWKDIAKAMNDQFSAHNADTDKLVEAIHAQVESERVHMARTDACIEEAKTFRTEVWNKTWDIMKWVIVISVGSLVVLAGGGAIFKFLGA